MAQAAPRQLHREQTAPIDTASGLPSLGVKRDPQVLQLTRSAPKETNESTHSTHQIMRMLLISWGMAGLFGFAFAQAAVESLQKGMTHSGTQSYVRVVR